MWLSDGDEPGPQLLKLIIKQAKDLRAVQIEDEKHLVVSPSEFDDDDEIFRLSDSPESVATLISEAFPKLEKIVLEEVWSIPAEEVQQWRRVKTLQVPSMALIIRDSSDSSSSRRIPEDHSLPAPTALTVSQDLDGDLYSKPQEWHGYSINFERIKDLRMEITGNDEYRLFNKIMQACHHGLESLRLFAYREPWDQALNLSRLSLLKSLCLVIEIIDDFANLVRVLSQIVKWLDVCDLACLEELCLYIHVDNEQRGNWLLQIIEGKERTQHKMSWRIINKKLGEIFEAKKRTAVSLKLSPSGNLSWEKILEYIHEVMPSTKDQNFHLKDTEPGSEGG
ncbi:hypothetical protein M378DRAFT_7835 [Amanita muscaria Koide BX008]|uniref:Uncharacterized protein n=1 Tax=Amanita muscaria (strain Koide BX008) TaxID=946122 RepID=A0A0C2XI26_AMAMK|nr:hypothetical protein M378DRAFT_7835 [Amanita muscaria Koide BX008]